MITCPDIGTWRAWMDGETAIPGPDEHLAVCGDCAHAVAELRDTADHAAAKLRLLDPQTARVAAPPVAEPEPQRGWLRMLAVAAAVAVFLAVPAGRDAAVAFLSVFRVEQFDVVQLSTAEALEVAGTLSNIATFEGEGPFSEPIPHQTVASAEQATGIDLPTLPPGTPDIYTMEGGELRIVLHGEATAAYLDDQGADVEIPPGYDGSALVIERAPAALVVFDDGSASEVAIARSGPISVSIEGAVTETDLREFFLQIPGIPDSVAAQLGAISDWRTTLPIPIPVDEAAGREVTIGGVEAVELSVPGEFAGYLWVEGEVITAVLGADLDDARQVTEDLLAG